MTTSEEIAKLNDLIESCNNAIDYEKETLDQLRSVVESINQRIGEAKLQKELYTAELESLKQRQAEEEAARKHEPHWDDERLQRALEALQSLPHYQTLREFQKADLAQILDAIVVPESRPYRGFINANDMGLGKTFETAMTLQTLAKLKEQNDAS